MHESTSDSEERRLLIDSELSPYVISQTDFTVYWPNEVGKSPRCLTRDSLSVDQHSIKLDNESVILVPYKSDKPEPKRPVGLKSINEQIELDGEFFPRSTGANEGKTGTRPEGRVCACSCYRNKHVSATVRTKTAPNISRVANFKPWKCSTWGDPNEYLIETVDLVEVLWQLVFQATSQGLPRSGLVVFAGSTNAGKSALAQSFALETIRLTQIAESNAATDLSKLKMPHLVTFEDPMEEWSVSTRLNRLKAGETKDKDGAEVQLGSPVKVAGELGFYFTPRQKGVDVADLESALLDAKRQTPACFYIGEVRQSSDWQRVIEFAGSGHLVVTTTHAANLSETLSRILVATKAETPAQRRSVAGSIAAAIHVVPSPQKIDNKKVLLPNVWTRTGISLNSIVADGLSSVIPNNKSVYSRSQIATHLKNERNVPSPSELLRNARRMDRLDLDLQ